MQVDALVLGAGVSGLSAAYHLQECGIKTLVIEKQKNVGGRTQSIFIGEVGVDSGALFLTNSYKRTFALIRELDIEQQVVPIRTRNGIVARDRIFTLPPHSYFDLARLLPLGSLLQLPGMLWEVLHHLNELDMQHLLKSYWLDSESVADFARRHGDSALLNYVFDPILQGIWYWDAAETTRVALFLLLKEAATIRLYTLKDGMGVLAGSLARHVDVRLSTEAIRSSYDPATECWKTVVRDAGGERTIESKTVLCTLPASSINSIFVELPETAREFFAGVRYTSIITAHLLLNQKTSIPRYYGLYYPAVGARQIVAIAIQSNTVPSQRLLDRSLVSIYASPKLSRELCGRSDEEAGRVLVSALASSYPFSTQDMSGSILSQRIIRVEPALPVFGVGYIRTLSRFHEALVKDLPPGLFFAGDYLGGPHMEGAIISAEEVVPKIRRFVQKTDGLNGREA